MREIVIIIFALLLVLFGFVSGGEVKRDCSIAEFSPDIPHVTKEKCR